MAENKAFVQVRSSHHEYQTIIYIQKKCFYFSFYITVVGLFLAIFAIFGYPCYNLMIFLYSFSCDVNFCKINDNSD